MAAKKKNNTQPSYTIDTVDGQTVLRDELAYGLTIEGVTHKAFEIREGTVQDMFAAEEVVHASKQYAFDAAVICQQLNYIGDFKGPFTTSMLGKLKMVDFEILRAALVEVELAGKPAPKSAGH